MSKENSRPSPSDTDQLKKYADDLNKTFSELKSTHQKLQEAYLDTIHRLVLAAEYKDEDTGDHIVRMSRYSALIAEKLRRGKKFMVQLLAPNEIPLNLRSRVRRQGQWAGSSAFRVTGVEFMPFGTRRGWNSLEALDVLRRLDEKYGKDEKVD